MLKSNYFKTMSKLSFIRLEGPNFEVNLCCYSYRFTQIAVDPQVKTPGGKAYDVLFIGTGKLTKLRSSETADYLPRLHNPRKIYQH